MVREKEEGKGFKVQDRRRFSQDFGEPREQRSTAEEASPPAQEDDAPAGAGEPEPSSKSVSPPINFSTFVISLSTQALMHLGEIPNPLNGRAEKDITVAKQMIDIISILRQKTRGNLDEGEDKLLEDVLYDLRMRYVEVVKKG